MTEHSVDPRTVAGDPFVLAGDQDHYPHACTDGLVFLAYAVFDETVGDEVERIEAVPCRRCREGVVDRVVE
jgi:hypothetical protein